MPFSGRIPTCVFENDGLGSQSESEPESESKGAKKDEKRVKREERKRPTKRKRLPEDTQITPRPLPHPPIPAPLSSCPTMIYLRPSTPFIPTLKRIRKLLGAIDARRTQSHLAHQRRGKGGRGGQDLRAKDVERAAKGAIVETARDAKIGVVGEEPRWDGMGRGHRGFGDRDGNGEVVYVRAAGRAIERALGIARALAEKGDIRVKIRTGTVGSVDDLETPDGAEGEDDMKDDEEKEKEEEELPESRVRMISYVELVISND